MKKINTILFDFDGTIMDTNEVILNSWDHVFNMILGHDADREEMLVHFGEPLELSMKNFFGAEGDTVKEYVDIYRSYQQDNFIDDIHLFEGVPEMLEILKNSGYTVALVTSRQKGTTMQCVEKFDLGRYFDMIITANDCSKHKPDPQPINITLEKLGKQPGEAVMLGDTYMDLGCAKNAGVTSILAGWSMALPPEKATGEAAPDYVLKSADKMLELLDRINSDINKTE